mgnify:CR=1 FL=1
MNSALSCLVIILLVAASAHGAEESVTLMGSEQVKVLYFEPESADVSPPLAIVISGGSNSEFMARAQFWMGKEMVSRGWAIAVPISPAGREYFIDNADHFPSLISDLHGLHRLKPGKTLLVGISSGGSAALAIASRHPEQYAGVLAAPGRLHQDIELGALDGLPVFLRVGEKDDFRWNKSMQRVTRQLRAAGAEVDAAEVPGARHIFTLDWGELEPWLEQVQRR